MKYVLAPVAQILQMRPRPAIISGLPNICAFFQVVINSQAALTAHKGKVIAQLQQEGFQMLGERGFEVALGIFVAQAQEFEHERMTDFFVGTDGVARRGLRALGKHGGLVVREGGALVKLAVDLALQLAHRPAAAQGLGVVKGDSLRRPAAANQQNVV
jgi:hypothetical protein